MKRALGVLAIVIAASMLLAGGILLWCNKTFQEPGPLVHEAVIVIERGASLRRIANQLGQADILRYPFLFVLKAKWTGVHLDLKAGEYAFTSRISAATVMEKIRKGNVVVHRITIPEGLTTHQAVKLIEDAPALDGQLLTLPAEGSLLPETYDYIYGDTRSALALRMKKAHDATLKDLWSKRAKGLPLADPQAATILASIVEKETADAKERPRIAAVFINRLHRNMRLQSDPTVVYALTGGKRPLGRPLTRTDLAVNHPYNTYVIKGLPPGPIANPGTASLAAVLQPAITKELYFVANGSGGHSFSKTLREHNRNVSRWRRLQRRQKSK